MHNEYAIQAKDLRKVYGSGPTAYEALRGVDLAVRPGEFVMLSGPSGSGKTTLLSILGCVLTPSSGKLTLMDQDLSRARESDLPRYRLSYIGFVFQAHNLIASLSARENITTPLLMRGFARREAEREADRLLQEVNLFDKRESLPRDLSGGQRQRVAIARALAGSPPLLLADEPTAALDAQNGHAITELLKKLAKDHGHTVVVVTHDNRIFHLADRIVHIEDGLITRGTEHAA
jgi:putative ABC transport system ATP-binding protein